MFDKAKQVKQFSGAKYYLHGYIFDLKETLAISLDRLNKISNNYSSYIPNMFIPAKLLKLCIFP